MFIFSQVSKTLDLEIGLNIGFIRDFTIIEENDFLFSNSLFLFAPDLILPSLDDSDEDTGYLFPKGIFNKTFLTYKRLFLYDRSLPLI